MKSRKPLETKSIFWGESLGIITNDFLNQGSQINLALLSIPKIIKLIWKGLNDLGESEVGEKLGSYIHNNRFNQGLLFYDSVNRENGSLLNYISRVLKY